MESGQGLLGCLPPNMFWLYLPPTKVKMLVVPSTSIHHLASTYLFYLGSNELPIDDSDLWLE